MAEDKGFHPTPKKIAEARRKGRVLKSQLLSQVAVLMAISGTILVLVRYSWVRNANLINYCFIEGYSNLESCSFAFLSELVLLVGGSLGAGAAVAVLVEAFQVGITVETDCVGLDPERCNPVAGVGRLWSEFARGWRTVVQLALLAVVLGFVVSRIVAEGITQLSAGGLGKSLIRAEWLTASLTLVLTASAGVLLVLGAFEYLLNRRAFYRELSMSADEVRREHREEEGDPQVKGARRSLHEALAMQDLDRRVRKARVVIVERNDLSKTNST
jgi:type III secretion protein U